LEMAAHAEIAGDAADGLLSIAEDAEDFAAGGVGEGTKDDVASLAVFRNHTVTRNVTGRFRKAKGTGTRGWGLGNEGWAVRRVGRAWIRWRRGGAR
jgi:hypothetical protein